MNRGFGGCWQYQLHGIRCDTCCHSSTLPLFVGFQRAGALHRSQLLAGGRLKSGKWMEGTLWFLDCCFPTTRTTKVFISKHRGFWWPTQGFEVHSATANLVAPGYRTHPGLQYRLQVRNGPLVLQGSEGKEERLYESM